MPPTAMQRSKVCGVGGAQRHAATTRSMPARSARRSVVVKPRRARELLDGERLAGAHLHGEERGLPLGGLRHEAAHHRQPVEPGVQGLGRLVAGDLGGQVGPVLDVGRVGDDRVDLAHAVEQVGVHEGDVEPEPRGVGARHGQRVLADVGRRSPRGRGARP